MTHGDFHLQDGVLQGPTQLQVEPPLQGRSQLQIELVQLIL